MCGIAAVFAFNPQGVNAKDVSVFTDLWRLVTLRGMDGAGLFYVGDKDTKLATPDGDPYSHWVKLGSTVHHLIKEQLYQDKQNELLLSRFIVGHARFATMGAHSTDNAHPFHYGDILMVHNGNVDSIDGIKADRWVDDNKKKFEVDSQVLCYALSKQNAGEVLNTFNGAGASIWYNRKDNTINVFRNLERPLYCVKWGAKLFFASEAWMLEGALMRNNHDAAKVAPLMVPSGELLTWNHEDIEPTITKIKLPEVIWRKGKLSYRRGPTLDTPAHNHTMLQKIINAAVSPLKDAAVNRPEKVITVSTIPGNEVPMREYWKLKRGDVVIFEPTNMEYLDSAKERGIIQGLFKEALPQRELSYEMLKDVRVIAKTHRTPKVPVQQLYQYPLLKGVISELVMNKNDITDVRLHLVDVHPFSTDAFQKLYQQRKHDNKVVAH